MPILVVSSETEEVSSEGVFSPCDDQGCSGGHYRSANQKNNSVSSEMCRILLC